MTKTQWELREEAKSDWKLWRLIFSGYFDYNTVFNSMSMDEVDEANAALDVYDEAVKKARNNAKYGRG